MVRRCFFVIVLSLAARPADAQFEQCVTYREAIAQITAGANVDTESLRLVEVGRSSYCFTLFVVGTSAANEKVFDQFVRRLESSRTDKEQTAGAAGTGATSVVSQGIAAKVLSAAYEYGALTRTVEKQIITLRGNLAGLPSALVRKDVFPYCAAGSETSEFCIGNSLLSWLRRVSFSSSFDAARNRQVTGTAATPSSSAAAQQVTFTADRSQLSAASLRVEIWNHRDVTSKTFADEWQTKVGAVMDQPSAELLERVSAVAEAVTDLPDYDAWRDRTRAAIRTAAPDRGKVVTALRAGLTELVALARAKYPDFDKRANDALAAYSRFFLAEDELIESLAKKNVAAVEYTLNRPVGEPDTHNVRFILDLPLTKRTKLLLNTAATFYGALPEGSPANASTYRDAQAGAQVDHSLGDYSIVGPASIGVAVYYQYQHTPAVLKVDPAHPIPGITFTNLPEGTTTVFTSAGSIVLGQVKLSIQPAGSSVKVPLAVTFSNRTELIDKPAWRAQVGLSYDFDALLGIVGK